MNAWSSIVPPTDEVDVSDDIIPRTVCANESADPAGVKDSAELAALAALGAAAPRSVTCITGDAGQYVAARVRSSFMIPMSPRQRWKSSNALRSKGAMMTLALLFAPAFTAHTAPAGGFLKSAEPPLR